jgi:hypothetical protein
MKSILLALVLVAGVVMVSCGGPAEQAKAPAGTPSGTPAGTPPPPPARTVAVVNSRCPILPDSAINKDAVISELVVEFEGQKIGFCCGGCPEQWNALTDAQKRAKLQAVMGETAPAPTTSQPPAQPADPPVGGPVGEPAGEPAVEPAG